ncbi:MAG: hemerythrin domain-containing protein [Ramlibacter sp.]
MEMVRSLFGALSGSATTAPAPLQRHSSPAPLVSAARVSLGRGPCYDPVLIPSLVSDHVALLTLVRRAATAAALGDAPSARQALRKFHSLLTDHLLIENTRLYLYIRSAPHAKASGQAQLSRAYQVEMNQIARTAALFVEQYTANDRAVLGPAFMVDQDSIRQTLAARFAREEGALYPLYVPQR